MGVLKILWLVSLEDLERCRFTVDGCSACGGYVLGVYKQKRRCMSSLFFITRARRGAGTAGSGLLLLVPGQELFEESHATEEIVGCFHYTDERIHAFVYNVG